MSSSLADIDVRTAIGEDDLPHRGVEMPVTVSILEVRQSTLVDAVTEFGPSGRVLDIGCGTGTHALWGDKQGHPAVGVGIF